MKAAPPRAGTDAASQILANKEPLLKKDIEKRRLLYVYKTLMDTAEARKLGMGDVSDARMDESAAMIKEAFDLPRTPELEDVFRRSFLPPKAGRMMPVLSN